MQKSQCERKYFALLSSRFKRGTFENALCLVCLNSRYQLLKSWMTVFTISFVVISQKRKMLNLNTVQESGMELHDQRQTGANTTDY